MKRIVLAAAAIAVTASASFAATSIVGSKHDLKANGGLVGGSAGQLCVYCHTPHNPAQTIPLWNRNAGAAITAVYNSPTLTAAAQGASIAATSISGYCMSCHDGATVMGNIKNSGGAGPGTVTVANITGFNTKNNLSTDLSNDHPVGFSYATAQSQDNGALNLMATANTSLGGNAFFGTSADQIECASCHKVHDNTSTPFLRISNAGSNLCLACHAK